MQSNITLSEPWPYCVYQRSNSGVANIPIVGKTEPGVAEIKAIFETKKVGDAQTLEYALPLEFSLPVNTDGSFNTSVEIPGGWYSLTLQTPDSFITLNRVGAGEVFVLFGHSFMSGNHDTGHQLPAQDERVCTVSDALGETKYQFEQLKNRVGFMGDGPDAWGQFGDKIVQKFGVPVLLINAAYGGSNILQNYQVINKLERTSLPPGVTDTASRMPFYPLEFAFDNYVNKTGIRAILVEHGYNDRNTSRDAFVEQFKNVFNYIRTRWEKPNLTIVLVQEQLTLVPNTLANPETAEGQKILLNSYIDTSKGPDFNSEKWNQLFQLNDHLFGPAIDQFAQDWADAISNEFIENSEPYGRQGQAFGIVTDYSAPPTVNLADYAILAVMAIVLVLFIIKRTKGLLFLFLALLLLSWGRGAGKI